MRDQPASAMPNQFRVIRVFVSSTFRDMHAERDELILRIFPQLRKLCESRGVTWSEVDLRWGITEEQSQRGEVLPICLAEIQRCRPYFIGLLGERYGWVPDEISPELIEQEPWLKEHLHHSVTELEILHGVLNDPLMADRALFYFRDPAFIDALPVDEQADYLELPTAEEIAIYGQPEVERRAEERRQKLASLKERIREYGGKSGNDACEDYANPQALGGLILRDFTEIIERLYPPGSEPDPLDREAMDHEAFAQSRARVYIGRQSYYDRLDEHARGDGPPLVVLGESGAGKSALLSNWALRYRAAHPDELLLLHFIGATPYSADWAAMLRRVMNEFKRRFDIQQEIPDQPEELRAAFANWLHMAAAKGKVVLLLDALNQLEDRDGAPDLVWLPPVIPANVRLIVSTLSGRALDDLKRRGWPTMQVELLEASERKQLIEEYLGQHAKQLGTARVARIANAKQTANPLYLRALLEELRVFGIYEKLDARIEHYLTATNVTELYEKILERYEQDYEREIAGLVEEAMSLLWAARRGLLDTELLELLGTGQEKLPRVYWSPLYLAAEASLVNRSGLICFGHDYLRQAVQNKYLSTKREQQEAHLRLADYFERNRLNVRKIEELPWQLAEAMSWQRLYDLLAEEQFFTAAWNTNRFEIKAYWAKVEGNSPLRMAGAYQSILKKPANHSDSLWELGQLMIETRRFQEALAIWEHLIEVCRQSGDDAKLLGALNNRATILRDLRETERALASYKEQERICRKLKTRYGLQACLGNQAVLFMDLGNLDIALALCEEQEKICRDLEIKEGLAGCLGNKGLIYYLRGQKNSNNMHDEMDKAMVLHQEQERICRQLVDKDGLSNSLGNQALVLKSLGDLNGALSLLHKQELLCREMGNKSGLERCRRNQALVLQDQGELVEAINLLQRVAKSTPSKTAPVMMKRHVQRFEQSGDDFAVIVENVPEACPQCSSSSYSYGMEFLDDSTLDGELDLMYLADRSKKITVEIICCLGHIVCREPAHVVRWADFAPAEKPESPEIGTIRKIWYQLSRWGLDLEYPSTGLLERSFLPGHLIPPDIWVDDAAEVSPTAVLKGPLLIEGRTVIGERAVCGPCAIIVDSTIPAGEQVSNVVLVSDEIVLERH